MSNFPRATWRLLMTPPENGATNMAIDEAVAELAGTQDAPPTLRFYAWSPPCVSLGRNQPLSEIDLDACKRLGYDVVRRPTGGRSILHTDELTYSVAGPADDPRLAGGVMDAYLRLAEALELGLSKLGLSVKKASGETRAGPDVSAACFETPSAYEITIGGRKLIGSAQSRRQGWVLQHGSLPLTGDVTRVVNALHFDSPAEQTALHDALQQRATTVEAALGRRVSYDEAANALATAFAEQLNLILEPGELTATERARVQASLNERYEHADWLARA